MLNPAVTLSSRSAGTAQPPNPTAGQPPGAPPFAQFLNEGIHANGPDPDKVASQGGGKPMTPEDEAALAAESQGPSETVTAQVRAARALAQRQRTAPAGQPGLDRSADAKAKTPDAPAPAQADADAGAATSADGGADTASRPEHAAADAGRSTLPADPSLAAHAVLPKTGPATPEASTADAGDKALRHLPLTAAVQQALTPAAAAAAEASEASGTTAASAASGSKPAATSTGAARLSTAPAADLTEAGNAVPDAKARSTSARSAAALSTSRAAAQGALASADARASATTATQAPARDAPGPTFEQLLAMPTRGGPADAPSGPFRADATGTPIAGSAAQAPDARPAAAPTESAPAVHAPLHSAAFAPELAERVTLLAVDGVQTAQLELNPAEMGPVQIDIVVDAGRAEITFQAAQADTRQALERALPDLAGALREQGLTLAGGGVFQQSQQGKPSENADEEGRPNSRAGVRSASTRSAPDAIDIATAALGRRGVAPPRGLLDTFA
jgi:flagellar hook-length control protein FliK